MTEAGNLLQAAAEYGAAAGGASSGVLGTGSHTLLDQGLAYLADHPVVPVLALLTLLVVAALLRTGRYRA